MTFTPVTKVAVAGGTGNLGPAVVQGLVDAGLKVTVLTRQSGSKQHTFPAGVNAAPVDYDSLESLVAVLQGQDAVVSTLASLALSKQLLLVQAAAKAGVRRFIPSEFGSNTIHPSTAKLPVYHDKIAVQDALRAEAAKPSGMSYTLVCNGPFLDWGIMVGFVMDLKNKKINLFDGGNRQFSTTTLPSVGRAVAGVLKNPDQTANRAVFVQDTAVSAKDLLAMGKRAAGSDGWTENVEAISDVVDKGFAELHKEKPNPDLFVYNFLQAAIWGEGYGALFEKLDNDLLGLKQLSKAEVQAVVNKYAQ